jgi:hypothetical protein
MSFVLTRNLYVKDEVEVSLLTALLKKQINEAYFWGFELHYSGFDLFAVLWRIYYDVYFEKNPYLESYLSKKQELWDITKQDDIFGCCIKNMMFARSGHSSKIFVLRQLAQASVGKTGRKYQGRPPAWCVQHPKKYHPWLQSISKKDYANIALHTYALVRESNGHAEHIYHELVAYFARIIHVESNANDYWNMRKYFDDAHKLLAIIVYLLNQNINNHAENIVVSLKPRKTTMSYYDEFSNDHIDGCPPYNILKERRLYGVYLNIGSFALARHTSKDICELNDIYHVNSRWEQFVFNTPFWVDKFHTYGATYDVSRKCVCFPDDDVCEEFYDLYGYEPDEQPRDVCDKSLGPIPSTSWKTWYCDIFEEPSIIDFDTTFQFVFIKN